MMMMGANMMNSVVNIVCSLLGAVCEVEAAVLDLTAHDYSQGKTILCHLPTHTSKAVQLRGSELLFHHVCSIVSTKDPVKWSVIVPMCPLGTGP